MKCALLLAGMVFVANGLAQQPNLVIYGTVVDQSGRPANGIHLTAAPEGPIGAPLPGTTTDSAGKYRFEGLPWRARYIVYAEDLAAGYSRFSTGTGRPDLTAELSPEHPEAEFNLRLPPKAGILHIRLTNRRTGAVIPGLRIEVDSQENPGHFLFRTSSSSDRPVLLPPDQNLLLHVTSSGFLEWSESAGAGKSIRMASGSVLEWDVQLEPDDRLHTSPQ